LRACQLERSLDQRIDGLTNVRGSVGRERATGVDVQRGKEIEEGPEDYDPWA